MKDVLLEAIKNLADEAEFQSHDPDKALKLSQAALNLAHVIQTLDEGELTAG